MHISVYRCGAIVFSLNVPELCSCDCRVSLVWSKHAATRLSTSEMLQQPLIELVGSHRRGVEHSYARWSLPPKSQQTLGFAWIQHSNNANIYGTQTHGDGITFLFPLVLENATTSVGRVAEESFCRTNNVFFDQKYKKPEAVKHLYL